MLPSLSNLSAQNILASLMKVSKKDLPSIICIASNTDKEEEDLMTYLSYEYRVNYCANLKDMLFGQGFDDHGQGSEPGFILEQIQAACYNGQQRKELMRACLKQIKKFKEKNARLKKGHASLDDLIDDDPPFNKKYRMAENSKTEKTEVDIFAGSHYEYYERKMKRLELKKHHFRVKSQKLMQKMTALNVIQKQVHDDKATTSKSMKGSVVIDMGASKILKTGGSSKPVQHPVSLKMIPSPNASTLENLTPNIGASEFDKYYIGMKANLKEMAKSQKRTKHMVFSSLEGGLDLMCAELSLSDKINKLSKDLWDVKRNPQKEVQIRVDALFPNSQKKSFLETRFDEKLGSFVKTNLPKAYELRKQVQKNTSLPNLGTRHQNIKESLAKLV